jgi:hypothetical protein
MPEKKTVERAKEAKREGKSPSTQAGEFVREEIHHIREGKHGASSPEQAIAIGLSKARRAGVELPAPEKGEASEETRRRAKSDLKKAGRKRAPSKKRSRASTKRLKRQPRSTASKKALSAHAKKAARRRSASDRSASARKAARTKGPQARSRAAKKAARTRARSR